MGDHPVADTDQSSTTDASQQWVNFWRFLQRRVLTIGTFLTITVLLVAAGTARQTPLYRATATILIDMETPSVLAISQTRDDFQLSQAHYLTYADYYRTQLEIISSRSIAERVFASLRLSEQPRYAAAADPVAVLRKEVTVEPLKATRLAKVHVEDPDPELAARIANEFALLFAEENLSRSASAEAMTLMKNQHLRLKAQEADLSKRYKTRHPAMMRIRQEKEQIAQAIEGELQRQQLRAQSPLALADSAAVEGSKTIVERMRDSATIGSLRQNNIRVQDLAQPPTDPAKPRKTLNLLLSVLLGLLGGVGLGALQEQLDSSVKSPEDIEHDRHLTLLGFVPRIARMRVPLRHRAMSRYQCVRMDPYSPAAESYRSLRTSLLCAASSNDGRALVVTSAGASEGKTTTVSNLGIALAHGGVKVLLVDADLRKGRLHDAFQLKRGLGLSEFLRGQASLEEIIQPTGIEGLSIVATGSYPPNPAELVGSARMRKFLSQTTGLFDRVLLDSPPIIVTDAAVLASMTERVVAIAKSGRTPRRALYRLNTVCREVRAKLLGIVLNNVAPLDTAPYYRYSGYRYAGPHGDGKAKREKVQAHHA